MMKRFKKEKFSFKDSVIKAVSLVPKGRVVSYGQIALYVGIPRAARQVGWILSRITDVSIPWWRVVNNKGRISIKGSVYSASEQRRLLIEEGVDIKEDFTFEIEKYRFSGNKKQMANLGVDTNYLNRLLSKV